MKRKSFFSIISIFIIICLIACSNSGSSSSNKKSVSVDITAGMNKEKESYPVEVKSVEEIIDEGDFDDATKFDGDIALISLIMADNTSREKKIKELFSLLELDNIVTNDNYDSNSADSISYCIGHYKDGSYDMIIVAVRGKNYGAEWASNFKLGDTGDHQGFLESATKVYNALTSYIDSKYKSSYDKGKVKLWFTGYSRGAAVANVLSYLVQSDPAKKLNVPQKHVFSYTFNTPRGLSAEHAINYPNVFNIISASDIVTYIAPEQYGMYRCGRDINIFEAKESDYTKKSVKKEQSSDYIQETVWYASRLDDLIVKFDAGIDLPKFRLETFRYKKGKSPGDSIIKYGTTEKATVEWLLDMVMTDGEIPEADPKTGGHSFRTRATFASSIQPYLSYAIELVLGNGDLMDAITTKIKNDPLNTVLKWFLQPAGLYNDVKGILDEKGIPYDNGTLNTACTAIYEMADYQTYHGCLTQTILKLVPMAVGDNKDLSRLVSLHQTDAALIMLLDYIDTH